MSEPDYAWAEIHADALSAALDSQQVKPENPLWRQEVTERLRCLCLALGEEGAARSILANHVEIDWGRARFHTRPSTEASA